MSYKYIFTSNEVAMLCTKMGQGGLITMLKIILRESSFRVTFLLFQIETFKNLTLPYIFGYYGYVIRIATMWYKMGQGFGTSGVR